MAWYKVVNSTERQWGRVFDPTIHEIVAIDTSKWPEWWVGDTSLYSGWLWWPPKVPEGDRPTLDQDRLVVWLDIDPIPEDM